MDYSLLLGVLAALIFAIFFSGIEVSFLSADKIQIELLMRRGNIAGYILTFFSERPTWLIGTTLIGNIASALFFGAFVTLALYPSLREVAASWWVSTPLLVALAFTLTVVLLYTVEILSKGFFIIHANTIVVAAAVPFALAALLVFPLVFTAISLAKLIAEHILRLEYSMSKPVFGLTDVNQYLKSLQYRKPVEQNIELDTKIFTNALQFRSVRVRECMIPRTEIVAVPMEGGIRRLHEAFIESGHSKIIVYRGSLDDVAGYCHSSALFKKPSSIEEILTPMMVVPETMFVKDLLERFINERKSLGIVIDEFGGTSGLVSMEDIVEEIFGEIEDEHDERDKVEIRIGKNAYILSARLEVDYLNDKYGWHLPTGDYGTLSGLIMTVAKDIPKQGEIVKIDPYTFTVLATAENRLVTVKMTAEEPAKTEDNG